MEIPINRDLRTFKTKDIGRFSFPEAGWLVIALVCGYGAFAVQKWLLHIENESMLPIVLASGVPLAFGFLKIKGMTVRQWLTTVFKEKYLSPKILFWIKEGGELKE